MARREHRIGTHQDYRRASDMMQVRTPAARFCQITWESENTRPNLLSALLPTHRKDGVSPRAWECFPCGRAIESHSAEKPSPRMGERNPCCSKFPRPVPSLDSSGKSARYHDCANLL